MENAMVDDLIPQTTKTYQLAGQSKRAIGGISMGGYGAARLTFRHPHLFSVDALISPAIWQKVPPTVQTNQQVDALESAPASRPWTGTAQCYIMVICAGGILAHFYIETTHWIPPFPLPTLICSSNSCDSTSSSQLIRSTTSAITTGRTGTERCRMLIVTSSINLNLRGESYVNVSKLRG